VPQVSDCFRHQENRSVPFSEGDVEKTLRFTPIFKGLPPENIGVIVSVI
jgi:hypothetical protein